MNEKVFNRVKAYNELNDYGTTEEDIIETIRDAKRVWKGNEDSHRWWNIYTYVVEINGMLIGYEDAESTGDTNAEECGYVFDSNSICEYEAKEKMIVVYEPKE